MAVRDGSSLGTQPGRMYPPRAHIIGLTAIRVVRADLAPGRKSSKRVQTGEPNPAPLGFQVSREAWTSRRGRQAQPVLLPAVR